LMFSYIYSSNVHELKRRAVLAFISPSLIIVGLAWVMFGRQMPLLMLQVIGLPLLAIGALNSVFNRMHSSEVPKGLQLRRSLESARRYFEHELARPTPRLRDEWFPYLLAFGLGPKVDRWFRSFGGSKRTSTTSFGASSASSTPQSASTSASSTPSWSGGGGMFAGGGASGSWVSAVGVVAAGVSKPSSGGSGGGGSGGGGGSSSGGGGGGGW
jgi:uncharacterized membrane protein YgcG